MRKVYYLSTCTTSKRIINDLELRENNFKLQDIKFEAITKEQLTEMYELTGSYEALFSKVARKYKELGLKDSNLQEEDFRKYILQEYTFLKRPVVIIDKQIFVGSSKANVDNLSLAL